MDSLEPPSYGRCLTWQAWLGEKGSKDNLCNLTLMSCSHLIVLAAAHFSQQPTIASSFKPTDTEPGISSSLYFLHFYTWVPEESHCRHSWAWDTHLGNHWAAVKDFWFVLSIQAFRNLSAFVKVHDFSFKLLEFFCLSYWFHRLCSLWFFRAVNFLLLFPWVTDDGINIPGMWWWANFYVNCWMSWIF